MKITVVEDHAMMRDFLSAVCSRCEGVEFVSSAETGEQAVQIIRDTAPDVVLLDLGLPDIDGFEVIRRIRNFGLLPRILAISSHNSPYLVFRLEKARVQGFIDKREQHPGVLREAVFLLSRNGTYFSESYIRVRANVRADHFSFDKLLSNQQLVVLSLVASGCDDEAIAKKLGISFRTVETHRIAIMRKLNLHSRLDLISYCKEQGFTRFAPNGGPEHSNPRQIDHTLDST